MWLVLQVGPKALGWKIWAESLNVQAKCSDYRGLLKCFLSGRLLKNFVDTGKQQKKLHIIRSTDHTYWAVHAFCQRIFFICDYMKKFVASNLCFLKIILVCYMTL